MKYFVFSEEKKLDAIQERVGRAPARGLPDRNKDTRAGSRATHLNDRLVVTSIRLVAK
ncbi:MAG: hypothetical protein ACHBMF_11730 [Chromatiales bacterium]